MVQSRLDLHHQMERIGELEEAIKPFKMDARHLAVQLFVRRMHSRYLRVKARQPFVLWLSACNRLERTFQYTGNGFGDQVRRAWALDDISELQKPELQLLNDPGATWVPRDIALHVNKVHSHKRWLLHAEYEQLVPAESPTMPGGSSLRFQRVQDPEWDHSFS
jgi:hypothetical protein